MADSVNTGNNELQIGVPIPRDVYDTQGFLLLKEGYVIQSQKQLEVLLQRGAHFLPEIITHPEPPSSPSHVTVELTPVERIDDLYIRLLYLNKQAVKADFQSRIIGISRLVQEACDKDADGSLGAVLLDKQDRYSIIHEIHCALVCEILLRHMGRSAESRLPLLAAGLTMNLSILELQDAMFLQQGKLSEEQRHEVRNHPYRSVELLRELGVRDEAWLTAVLQHHELMDQNGYPQGLGGNDIFEDARLLTLADVYCAKLFPRAYRAPLQPTAAAYDIFTGARGHSLDKDLSRLFISELGMFHPGSFVRLKNGEIAVVARRGEKIHHPVVYSVVKTNGDPYFEPRKRDCSLPEYAIAKSIARHEVKVQINTISLWGRT